MKKRDGEKYGQLDVTKRLDLPTLFQSSFLLQKEWLEGIG